MFLIRFHKHMAVFGVCLLVFAFFHSWFVGRSLQTPPLEWVWPEVIFIAAMFFFYHRIIRPGKLGRHRYRIIEVKPEIDDVWIFALAPPGKTDRVYFG